MEFLSQLLSVSHSPLRTRPPFLLQDLVTRHHTPTSGTHSHAHFHTDWRSRGVETPSTAPLRVRLDLEPALTFFPFPC
jgi:hypothetical protein